MARKDDLALFAAQLLAGAASGALTGAAVGTGVAAGSLTGDAKLTGAAVGTGVAAGDLVGDAKLSGAAVGTGVAAGSLTATTPSGAMSGAAVGTGVAAGDLRGDAKLSGAAVGTGVATGALASTPLSGAAVGTGVAAGALSGDAKLSGAAVGTGVGAGSLSGDAKLSGAAVGTGVAAGSLSRAGEGDMTGAAVGTSTAAGTLTRTWEYIDEDITPTAHTDCDGTTLRPSRPILLHAMDDGRNAGLTDFNRLDMDRYEGRSLRSRANQGHHVRLLLAESRAGASLAPREFVITLVDGGAYQRVRAADTTTRDSCDGTKMVVGTTHVALSPDDGLNSALVEGSTDQDRFFTNHNLPVPQSGFVHRLLLSSAGRAGTAWSPREMTIRYNDIAELSRAKAR